MVGPARKESTGKRQVMNGSFDRVVSIRRLCEKLRIAPPSRPLNLRSLRLANTFGAFGSVPVHKSKFYGAFVLNRRVDLHAIDATPAR